MFKYNVRNYPDNRGIKNFVFFLGVFQQTANKFLPKNDIWNFKEKCYSESDF